MATSSYATQASSPRLAGPRRICYSHARGLPCTGRREPNEVDVPAVHQPFRASGQLRGCRGGGHAILRPVCCCGRCGGKGHCRGRRAIVRLCAASNSTPLTMSIALRTPNAYGTHAYTYRARTNMYQMARRTGTSWELHAFHLSGCSSTISEAKT